MCQWHIDVSGYFHKVGWELIAQNWGRLRLAHRMSVSISVGLVSKLLSKLCLLVTGKWIFGIWCTDADFNIDFNHFKKIFHLSLSQVQGVSHLLHLPEERLASIAMNWVQEPADNRSQEGHWRCSEQHSKILKQSNLLGEEPRELLVTANNGGNLISSVPAGMGGAKSNIWSSVRGTGS